MSWFTSASFNHNHILHVFCSNLLNEAGSVVKQVGGGSVVCLRVCRGANPKGMGSIQLLNCVNVYHGTVLLCNGQVAIQVLLLHL